MKKKCRHYWLCGITGLVAGFVAVFVSSFLSSHAIRFNWPVEFVEVSIQSQPVTITGAPLTVFQYTNDKILKKGTKVFIQNGMEIKTLSRDYRMGDSRVWVYWHDGTEYSLYWTFQSHEVK